MTTRDELRAAMASIDFTDPDWVVIGPESSVAVFSARMPSDWNDRILAEMARRRLDNPSQLIRALVWEGLDRAERVPVAER